MWDGLCWMREVWEMMSKNVDDLMSTWRIMQQSLNDTNQTHLDEIIGARSVQRFLSL